MYERLSKSGICLKVLLLIAGLVTISFPAWSQTFYGSVVGTVTDSSGAVVAGATVTITNLGTNEKRSDTADAAGNYQFVNLVPANYKVEVARSGFKSEVREPVTVEVGSTVRINAALQVGAATETVQVTTAAPLLQTESGAESAEVEGETVQQMPLNGRNPMNLIALTPGAVPQGSSGGNSALNQGGSNTQPGGWGNYAISGGIAGDSAMYYDGAPNNVLGENDVALMPVQDAIQEFNIVSSSVPAEYGRFAGGVVNMTSKSGTNGFHGSAYEYVRNRDFNANDWFLKNSQLSSGQPNTPQTWTQNQFGVVLGGPIKRDKAFFLFTWEAFRLREGSVNTWEVPTQNQQNGIFSSAITDPLGNCIIAHNAAAGTWTITNLATCESPTAAIMAKYYLLPNYAGSTAYNYVVATPSGGNEKQYNGRIDYNLSDKQRIFGRYTYWTMDELPFSPFPSNTAYNTANPAHAYATHQVVLGDTFTVNPTNILDLRISWLHQQLNGPMPTTSNYSQFGGDWTSLSKQMSAQILPYPYLSSEGGESPKFHPYGPQYHYQTNWAVSLSWVRIVGKHSLKAGWEGRLENQEEIGSENSGSFAFSGLFTGNDFADMLMGYPDNSGSGPGGNNPGFLIGQFATGYNYYQGYYVQDNWTATKNLTLNLGLRWDLPGSIAEAHNNQTVLLPNTVDPVTHITGTVGLVDSSIYDSKNVKDLKYDALAPRFGFAYRLGNNMAIRGGYGLTWLPVDIANGLMPYNSVINSAGASINNESAPLTAANLCTANPGSSNCFHTLANPLQPAGTTGAATNNQLIRPVGRSEGQGFMSQYVNNKISGPVPTDPYAYNGQWNFSVSRQFAGNLMVELGYAGAKGTHLPIPPLNQNGFDQLPDQYDSLGAALTAPTTKAVTDAGGYSVAAGGMTVGQSLRPYPFYKDVGDSLPMWGSTTYNAGHITVQKRFWSSGLVMANYTWSKMIGNTDTVIGQSEVQVGRGNGAGVVQDWDNHAGERSILSYDVPQRLVVAYIVPLPFGHGQAFGGNVSGVADRIVSGWALNGITSFQDGFPVYLLDGTGNYLTNSLGGGQLRPSYIAGCSKQVSGGLSALTLAGKPVFNTACFSPMYDGKNAADPVNFEFGNEPRVDNTLRAQGVDNWDLSLVKTTKIFERSSLELRAEFFNIMNHYQFGPPANDVSSGSFGQLSVPGGNPRLLQFSGRVNF